MMIRALDEQVAAFDAGGWSTRKEDLPNRPLPKRMCCEGFDPAHDDPSYRMRGHLAQLDPLRLEVPSRADPETYGFTPTTWTADLHRSISGLEYATIRRCSRSCKRTYCSTIGIEFMHISDPEEKSWMQERIEGPDKGVAFTE
jgi:2-oxoglutarate dehydrogenase E1 component